MRAGPRSLPARGRSPRDLLGAQLLAVFARHGAAQQLDDFDGGILLPVLGAVRGIERRGIGVESERVERRYLQGLRLADGRQPRYQPRIRLIHDVVAAAPSLPHRIGDNELGRHGPAGDQSLIRLGDRPAQPIDACRWQSENRKGSVADTLQLANSPPSASRVSVEPAMTTRMASTPTPAARQVLKSQRKRPLWRVSAWSLA